MKKSPSMRTRVFPAADATAGCDTGESTAVGAVTAFAADSTGGSTVPPTATARPDSTVTATSLPPGILHSPRIVVIAVTIAGDQIPVPPARGPGCCFPDRTPPDCMSPGCALLRLQVSQLRALLTVERTKSASSYCDVYDSCDPPLPSSSGRRWLAAPEGRRSSEIPDQVPLPSSPPAGGRWCVAPEGDRGSACRSPVPFPGSLIGVRL